MKKIFTLFLALAIAFSLAACGGSSTQENVNSSDPAAALSSADSSEDDFKKSESGKDESDGISTGEGDTGLYHIKIIGASSGKDYEGNDVITITYEWTNNSDETTSALAAILETAFQDGVQLDTAILNDATEYSVNSWKEIRPGTTLTVETSFVLTSDSTVECEICDWLNGTNQIVSMNFEPASLN